jgi:hypothetical protein
MRDDERTMLALASAGVLLLSCYRPLRGEALEGVSAMTDNEAQQIAHGLIQGYLGPDHKVIDMQSFYRALVEALLKAHHQG